MMDEVGPAGTGLPTGGAHRSAEGAGGAGVRRRTQGALCRAGGSGRRRGAQGGARGGAGDAPHSCSSHTSPKPEHGKLGALSLTYIDPHMHLLLKKYIGLFNLGLRTCTRPSTAPGLGVDKVESD